MSHQVLKSLFWFQHADSLEAYFHVNSMKYVFKNDKNRNREEMITLLIKLIFLIPPPS